VTQNGVEVKKTEVEQGDVREPAVVVALWQQSAFGKQSHAAFKRTAFSCSKNSFIAISSDPPGASTPFRTQGQATSELE
jgi:hypothetical protein